MLGLEGGGVRTFGRYVSAENGKAYAHIVAAPYNITARFQVGAMLPVIWKSPEGGPSRTGIGDVTVFAKQQVFQKDGRGKTLRALLKGAVSAPSGNTSKEPALGSGAWQAGFGAAAGHITTRFGLYAETGYRWVSDGLPDQYFYNLAASVPLLPQKYPPRQLNLSADLNGNVNASTGSHALFLSPGLQYIAGRRLLVETGIQLPLSEEVPAGQQTNFVFLLGTRILIF